MLLKLLNEATGRSHVNKYVQLWNLRLQSRETEGRNALKSRDFKESLKGN